MAAENNTVAGIHAAYALLAIGWIVIGLKLAGKFFKDSRKWYLHDLYSVLGLVRGRTRIASCLY